MPSFGRSSIAQLSTAHVLLQRLFQRVVLDYDCVVLEGHRGQQAQDRAFAEGRSKLKFPNGNHNAFPSNAVDVAPYDVNLKGVNWKTSVLDHGALDKEGLANLCRFYHFAGIVKGIGLLMGIQIRWGGDWNGDNYFSDQTFNDLPHFEIVPPKSVVILPDPGKLVAPGTINDGTIK
jgi:peptidoglycan L-alanyl-D-glutamate endopeptidase CwlK